MAKYTFNLVLGDWSDDGHGISEEFTYSSGHNKEAVMQAYMKGCDKVGVSLHASPKHVTIADEYEDSTIQPEATKLLMEAGFDMGTLSEQTEGDFDEPQYIDDGDFEKLFLFLVRVGNPKIKLTRINIEPVRLNGFWDKKYNFQMGYGLYSR